MSNSKDRVFIIYLADVDVELFFVLETMHTYQENYFGSSLFANKDLKLILIVLKNALIWDNLEKFWRRRRWGQRRPMSQNLGLYRTSFALLFTYLYFNE